MSRCILTVAVKLVKVPVKQVQLSSGAKPDKSGGSEACESASQAGAIARHNRLRGRKVSRSA